MYQPCLFSLHRISTHGHTVICMGSVYDWSRHTRIQPRMAGHCNSSYAWSTQGKDERLSNGKGASIGSQYCQGLS